MDDSSDHDGPPDGADKPAPQPQGIPKDDTPNAKPSSQKNDGQRDDALDQAMVHWTRIVGLFTIVLAGVGGIQSWAFIQSERAAIYPQIERISPIPLVSEQPMFVDITLINSGRAQAFFSEARIGMWGGTSLPNKPDFSHSEFTVSGFIPPGNRRYITVGPIEPAFNWAQIGEINRGGLFLYIYGFVKFTDDFSIFGPKIIGFCGRYEPSQIGKAPGATPTSDCQNANYEYSR